MVNKLDRGRSSRFPRPSETHIGWLVVLLAIVTTVVSWLRLHRRDQSGQGSDGGNASGGNASDGEAPHVSPASPDIDDATATSGDAKAVPAIDTQKISDRVARKYKLVPEIGKGWRWYDIPYRLLLWTLTSWRRRLVPWQLRFRLNDWLNFFRVFNHYERLKVAPLDDPRDNLIVPSDEELTQGGIWVIELFPPSMYSNLRDALERNGWDAPNYSNDLDGTNVERVTQARRGSRFMWTQIGAVADPKTHYSSIGTKREILPTEFSLVTLTAVQLGHSVTAVTASFRFSDQGKNALNNVWKAEHEPMLSWRGFRRPHAEARHFAAIRTTQRERKRLHDLARTWLAERCGGFFAGTESRHPVLDFNLFAKFDPTASMPSFEMREPLRALGMSGDFMYNYTSPALPGAVLVQGESLRPYDDENLRNCWGVVASYDVFTSLNDHDMYGGKPYSVSALTAMSDEAIRGFLMSLAMVRYTEQLGETLSDARDTAQSKHREFSPRQVERLRRELLTSSLDLPVVARDTAFLWEPELRAFYGIQVRAQPIPGRPYPAETFDLIQKFANTCTDAFQRLMEDDGTYRDVLSTASALGASAASNRLSTRALVVSGTSLVVSVTAVLTANDAGALHHVSEWLTAVWDFWLHHGTNPPAH